MIFAAAASRALCSAATAVWTAFRDALRTAGGVRLAFSFMTGTLGRYGHVCAWKSLAARGSKRTNGLGHTHYQAWVEMSWDTIAGL